MKKIQHLIFSVLLITNLPAADWPTWGGDATRNMVSFETGLDFDFEPGEMNDDESVDMSTTKKYQMGGEAWFPGIWECNHC